jgi:hypothetical protein
MRLWHEWAPVIAVSAIVLPLVAILGWRYLPRATRVARLSELGMVLGTLPWIWMILTPKPAHRSLELTPLLPLVQEVREDSTVAALQIGGNLLVFAAFGFFARLRWRLAFWKIVALAALGSVVVELLQWYLDLGRVTSVDDVLLNAAGAGIAALAAHGSVSAWTGPSR